LTTQQIIYKVLSQLRADLGDNLISIYGIGSYFDTTLPSGWLKNDVDIISMVKSIKNIPKEYWETRFRTRKIHGYEVFFGYNTVLAYHDKNYFHEISGANYEWSLIEIKHPENSILLHGIDIRDQLPDTANISFDFDDLLARGLYHIEKSFQSGTKYEAKKEFSKAIFKTAFYFCLFFDNSFRSTSITMIKEKLKKISSQNKNLIKVMTFLEEAILYRINGKYSSNVEEIREEFLLWLVSLLEKGMLHRVMSNDLLIRYMSKNFGGFPKIIHKIKGY